MRVFLFGVKKIIAINLDKKCKNVSQKNVYQLWQTTNLNSNAKVVKMAKKRKKLSSKTPKNEFLTLNYGLPSGYVI